MRKLVSKEKVLLAGVCESQTFAPIAAETQGDRSHPGFLPDLVVQLKGNLHGLIRTDGDTEFTGNALVVVKGDPHLFS